MRYDQLGQQVRERLKSSPGPRWGITTIASLEYSERPSPLAELWRLLLVTVVGFVALTAVFFNVAVFQYDHLGDFAWLLAGAVLFWALLAGRGARGFLLRANPDALLAVVVAAAVLLRLYFIARLATRPVYDFLAYHAVAQQLAAGAGLSALEALDGRPWGYPLLLGGLYHLLGVNLLWPQLLNVLFSALAIIFLYHIVRRLAEPRLAVLAALVYALFPSQVLMNNVVNSEVVFIGLALGGVYYSLRFLDTLAVGDLVATGALLSLAHLVRPVGVLYLAVFLLVLLVRQGSRPLDYLKMAGVALLSFYLVLAPLLVLKSVAYGRPVFWDGGTFGIVFLMGTNMYHQGFWNQDDYAYVQSLKQQYGGDMGKVNDAAFDAAWRRLRANFAQIREMMPAKAYKMWSIDTFAFDWANRGGQDQWLVQDADARRWYYGVSQAFWASLWLGLLGFLVAFPLHRHREVNYLLLLFLAFFGLHLLIEIQGRYHMHLAPLIIAVAAVGMGSLWTLKEREG